MQRADTRQRDQHAGAQHHAEPLDVGLALAAQEPAGFTQHALGAQRQFPGAIHRRASSTVIGWPVNRRQRAVAETLAARNPMCRRSRRSDRCR